MIHKSSRIPATHKVWAVGETVGNNNIYQTLTEFRC